MTDEPEDFYRQAYDLARNAPREALRALLPHASEATLDGLVADPALAIDNQPPMPSKMARTVAPLELRRIPAGTKLLLWGEVSRALVDAVRAGAGDALVEIYASHDDPWMARVLLEGTRSVEDLTIDIRSLEGAGSWLDLPALRSLHLHGDVLGAELATWCASAPRLAELRTDGVTTLEDVRILAGAALTKLAMYGSTCGDEGAELIGRMTSLTELWLGSAEVGDLGAAALAGLTRLTVLELSRSAIGDAGATALAVLPAVEYLYLSHNRLTRAGASALTAMRSLTHLDVSHNAIDDDGVKLLAALTALRSLDAVGNPMTDIEAVRAALRAGLGPYCNLTLDEEDEFWNSVP